MQFSQLKLKVLTVVINLVERSVTTPMVCMRRSENAEKMVKKDIIRKEKAREEKRDFRVAQKK